MFPNLAAEMARYRIPQISLAQMCGLSDKGMSNKMCGKSHFSLDEMRRIQLAIPSKEPLSLDYLFEQDGELRSPKGA